MDEPDKDLKSCLILSVALSKIIKHTVNNKFRDECFKELKVDNSLGAQTALEANLSSIVRHPGQFTQEQRKSMKNKKTKKSRDDKIQ